MLGFKMGNTKSKWSNRVGQREATHLGVTTTTDGRELQPDRIILNNKY